MEDKKKLLNNFREQIDWIDREILYLLFRRFTLVGEIWKIKKEIWMSALQENRWNEVLNDKIEAWEEYWLKKDFIEDIWNRIHKEALEIEK